MEGIVGREGKGEAERSQDGIGGKRKRAKRDEEGGHKMQ